MKKIENEKKRTAEVEAEIEAVQKEVAEQRKAVGGIKLAEQENLRKQKQVKALEVSKSRHQRHWRCVQSCMSRCNGLLVAAPLTRSIQLPFGA